jgi:heme/copper-type cytochrome/quinol oxidase subunit 3
MLFGKRPPTGESSLKHVRAAQLRAVAVRWALGKTFFGLVFLVGAMAHAFGPQPLSSNSALWIALLLLLSTVNVGLGLRGFARVRRRGLRLWLPATIVFGLSATVMLRLVAAR